MELRLEFWLALCTVHVHLPFAAVLINDELLMALNQ